MKLPTRVMLSKSATDKLRLVKARTGLTPNVTARIAIMLAVKDGKSIANASVGDTDGQVLSRDVLFGDYAEVYQALLTQYAHDNKIDTPPQLLVAALIEIGAFNLGHVKKLQDLVF